MINRRSFIKTTAAGIALTALPNVVLGAGKKSPLRFKSSVYEDVNYDVVVVGAGASGIPAAIAAARQGAKVALIDEDPVPGGAPVDMYVSYMCGGPRIGIFKEMLQGLNANAMFPDPTFGEDGGNGKSHWWHPTNFLQVIMQMLMEEPNISLIMNAPAIDVVLSNNKVTGVVVLRNGSLQNIKGKVTIDATGIGLISEKAGCEIMFGAEAKSDYNEPYGVETASSRVQPCTQMFISHRVKAGAVLPIGHLERISIAEDQYGWLKENAENQGDDPVSGGWQQRDSGIYLHWGYGQHYIDTRDPQAVAASQLWCLDKLKNDIRTLSEAGFAVELAPKIGIRECRRVKGEYVLTANELKAGWMPEDRIATSNYMLDSWSVSMTKEEKTVPLYGIPYRSLIPLGVEGLLTAGRIISGTSLAASSYRVQPPCAAIGQAAGIAASMAAFNQTSVRNIPMEDFKCELIRNGLYKTSGK
ncbi:MAG: FAD-dependent oxidoreductase [Candidatus Symbiothrix sp.]|jgi:hypothetical protein|nr:FAD-dependent oxidoreductase [Candidatus Symbiothrix sp.]